MTCKRPQPARRALTILGLVLGAGALSPLLALDASMPTSLPPYQVGVDSIECGMHIDCSHPGALLIRPENRIVLCMPLPVQGALLHLQNLAFERVASDQGEWLAVLVRPGQREQSFTAENPANRDRQLRLTLELSPPFHPCQRLHGLHGHLTLSVARGEVSQSQLSARIGAGIACGSVGTASIVDRTRHGYQVRMPSVVYDRLSSLVGLDAAGIELPTRLHAPATASDGWTSLELQCELEHCATIRLSWWPQVESHDIVISIPDIDIPGGIPSLDGLALKPGTPPPTPVPAALQDPLNIAVARQDLATARELLQHGAGCELSDRDGRCALARAAALGEDAMVALLLEHHAPPSGRGSDGWSPLAAAALGGSTAVVARLLSAGADPQLALPDGRTSLEVARDSANWRILSMLLGNPGPE